VNVLARLLHAAATWLGAPPAAAAVEKSAGAAAVPAQGYLPTLGATPSSTGLLISQGTAMAASPVYGCVTIRAQDVARCTPRLFRRDGKGKRVQVDDHPVARFFRQPNAYQTWFEFIEQMEVGYLLRGNAYAAIRRDGRGVLRDMIAINPDAVLVLEAFDGGVFYNVNRIGLWQIAMLREFPSSMASEDIFHLRNFSFNTLAAASTIGLARDSIGVGLGLEQQSARIMANGSRPSVVLQSDKVLSEASANRLKQQWRELTAGIANTGQTVVLEDGLKAIPLQITSVDMEFMAQRNFQVQDACRFFRVPPFKLGLTELRGINIDQINQDYVNNTVMPDLHRWEQKIEKTFALQDQGLSVSLDETVLLRADITTRYTAARIALGGQPFSVVNEVRSGEGMPDLPGGDELMRPVNIAAVGSDLAGTAPDGAGHPLAAEGGVPGADAVASPKPNASEAAQADAETASTMGRAADVLAKAGLPLKFNEDEPRDSHGRWIAGLSSEQKRALRSYMGDDYTTINTMLRAGKKPPGRYGEIVKQMDSAMKSVPRSTADQTLYRGIDKDGVAALKVAVGSVIKDAGFVSTSSDLSVAKSGRSFAARTSDNLMMRISVPAGSRVASIASLADDPGEQEMLIGRGASFKVNGWDAGSRTLDVSLVKN
jgi:HK97 family phage portal protein